MRKIVLIEAKIIRHYVNFLYFFSNNISYKEKELLINYLESVLNTKLMKEIKDILLNNLFTRKEINYFSRRYQYLQMNDSDEVESLELAHQVYMIAKESVADLDVLKLGIDDEEMSPLKTMEMLKTSIKLNFVSINLVYALANHLGILFDKDVNVSQKYFTKNALWNDELSTLCLAYNYLENGDFIESYYWYSICKNLGFTDGMNTALINAINGLDEKELNAINKKIKYDTNIHRLLDDERANAKYDPKKYDPNLSMILYEGKFDINEKKMLLFAKGDVDFSHMSSLVFDNVERTLNNVKYDFRNEEQNKIIDVLKRMVKSEDNYPIIITCKSKVILSIFSNLINGYFEGYVVKSLDAARCDNNLLTRYQARNNYLYQVFTSNETDSVVIKYHNLHEIKEGIIDHYVSLLMPDNKYYFQDIRVSANKSNLINIIFCVNIDALDNRIVHSSNVIELDKAKGEEKEQIVRTKFAIELDKKELELKDEYEPFIDKIIKKVNYEMLDEAVNEVVARLNFGDFDDIEDVIKQFSSGKGIGF